MKNYRKEIPILDADLEAGDTYLAELARRAIAAGARPAYTHNSAILDWIN